MKKLFLALAVALLATVSYAQRDIRPGSEMEVADAEVNDCFFAIYKTKDLDGNSTYLFCASREVASFSAEIFNSLSTFSAGEGVVLLFGETYEDAMENLEELLDLFSGEDGDSMEFAARDGSAVTVVLRKGLLGKHLDIGPASITRSSVKSLRTSLKISKKLHKDI